MRLVLASASPARLATLRAAGIEPEVRVSAVDEDAALAETEAAARAARGHGLSVAEQVAELARAKAQDVAAALGEAQSGTLVLGCDSLLEFDGAAMGKPATAQVAIERWRAMRGRSGVLHTGHCLIDCDSHPVLAPQTPRGRATNPSETDHKPLGDGPQTPRRWVAGVSSTVVRFADVTDEEIEAYVATGEPLAVAGAFTIDGLGGAFIEGIDGDHHGVVGLSLPLLRRLLHQLGHRYLDLWSA